MRDYIISSSEFSYDTIKDRSKLPITIGFSLVLLLILALVVISLSQLKNINMSLSTLVEETNIKLQSANSMRDAIRLRADSLKKMRLMDDPFLRDEELMKFYQYSGIFRSARENLVQVPMSPEESDILTKMTKTIQQAQPLNDEVAEKLFNTMKTDKLLLARAEKLQQLLLKFLDALVAIENQSARTALSRANSYFLSAQYSLFAIATIVMVLVISIGIIVIRLVANKNKLVSYHAMHDPLTDLFNRSYFEHQVKTLLEKGVLPEIQHALLYMDLDQFKVVNDTCGHVAGDELLKQITSLLKTKIRKQDTFARLGGDEFGLLLKGCDLDQACLIAEELRKLINDYRFSWDNKLFSVGVSIGIAPISHQTLQLKEILIAADTACFAAKDAGRNSVHVYQPKNREYAEYEGQIQWISELSEALIENRFELYAQAIHHVNNGTTIKLKGYEVFVRFVDKLGKVYQPGAFLPTAERYGRITDIDLWVIKNTFKYLASTGVQQSQDIVFSINISGRSLGDVEFKNKIHVLFKEYKIPEKTICFEITETAAIARFDHAINFINEFKQKGCSFALDDFGSGLSSFAYLKQLPVNVLKIDDTFIQNIDAEPIDYAMVKSINEIAHLHGKKTVAESVESKAVFNKLLEIGVDYAQGSAVSEAIKLSDI